MPIYEYQCRQCGHRFEYLVLSQTPPASCPECRNKDVEQLISGARVANPASRNILEKCGFQWSGVELHRFEALGSSTPVDCFRLSRGVWASLKSWGNSVRRER